MSEPQLTSQQYAKSGGVKCPACQSKDIEGGPIEVDAGIAWQEISCNDCNAEWQDQYTLIGYTAFKQELQTNPDGQQLPAAADALHNTEQA